jgi:hypothetical protein
MAESATMSGASSPDRIDGNTLALLIAGCFFAVLGWFYNILLLPTLFGLAFLIWALVRVRKMTGRARTIVKVVAIIGLVIDGLAILGSFLLLVGS